LKGDRVFKKKTHDETTTQDLIDAANSRLFGLEPDTDEYNKVLDQIERLHKLKSRESEGKMRVSPDTLIIVGANLLGIVLILNYEKLDIVTSKALGFVGKSKI
jgi:hypothetical protein